MLTTTAYHMTSEVAYRQDRIARDWRAARRSLRSASGRARRSTGLRPERRLGGATLA